MRVKILTLGSRGDVQPFVALAKGLIEEGYKVEICTGKNFKNFVLRNNIPFNPVNVDYLELAQSNDIKQVINGNPLYLIKRMKDLVFPLIRKTLDDLWETSKDADAIIFHPKAFGAYDIAKKLNIPIILAHPIPAFSPTSAFASPIIPFDSQFGFINKLTYSINNLLLLPYAKLLNDWRKQKLNLPKRSIYINYQKTVPIVYGCSPLVLPKINDWGTNVYASGYWFLNDNDWEPSSKLRDFINIGPPICISLSSVPLKNPKKYENIFLESIHKTNKRAIILKGWSGMEFKEIDENIFILDSAPHSILFQKCDALVIHGGAGTVAEAARSGKPMIVCPFFGDQPFWAERMYSLGVSPKPIPAKKLSVEKLSEALRNIDAKKEKAYRLGKQINSEQGIYNAVKFIKKYF